MKKINYKSDFDFILRLKDCQGENIGWPSYDWAAKFYTSSKVNAFTARCINGITENCYNDNGNIHIVANNHKLTAGTLHVEFTAELPDSVYPDSEQRLVIPLPLDIELITAAAPCPESFEIEMMIPYIKVGYDDYTPEQIAELQKPAVEAAERADKAAALAITAASNAENAVADTVKVINSGTTVIADMTELEKSVNSNEGLRQAAERERQDNETLRIAAERSRSDAEAIRKSAETGRVSAEKQRAGAETKRQTAEEQRVSNESQRVTDESARKSAETARQTAESSRVSAETKRVENETTRQSQLTTAISEAEAATTKANEAANNANEAVDGLGVALAEKADKSELGNVTSESTEIEIEDIEPNILNLALRKTEQYLTDSEKAQVKKNLDISKKELFIDLWNAACGGYGTYNKETGFFELNGVTDITWEEAIRIYNAYSPTIELSEALSKFNIRTNIPMRSMWGGNLTRFAQNNISIISVCLPMTIAGTYMMQAFYGCKNLKSVTGLNHLISAIDANAFNGCTKLETLEIANLKSNLIVSWSGLLTLDSFIYIVSHATNTTAITITVHPDVYAKLTDTSNTAWHQLLTDAAAKNISFATV